jgi:hypothetical protein
MGRGAATAGAQRRTAHCRTSCAPHRWQYLLEPLGADAVAHGVSHHGDRAAASSVLPARAGEFLRPYLLARREGLSATATFATVVVERMLDLVAVLVLLAPTWRSSIPAWRPAIRAVPRRAGRRVVMGALSAVGPWWCCTLLAGHPERLHGLVLQVERVLPGAAGRAVAAAGADVRRGARRHAPAPRVLVSLGLSLVMWLVIAARRGWWSGRSHIEMPFGARCW